MASASPASGPTVPLERSRASADLADEQYLHAAPTGERHLDETSTGERHLDEAPTGEQYLRATPMLDIAHPAIQAVVRDRGWADLPVLERIGAGYAYVRDEIPFGYNATDDRPASAVLADGYGQCNTKTTLLMALLRAVGVPCRLHGATVRKQVQRGVVPGLVYRLTPRELVHTWAEVPVAGVWTRLEGVILDRAYLDGLRRRFPQEDSVFLGYGVATDDLADPPIEWRGADTAIQAAALGRDHGVYDDPDDFYVTVGGNLSGLRAVLYARVVRHMMNRTVVGIRCCPAGVET